MVKKFHEYYIMILVFKNPNSNTNNNNNNITLLCRLHWFVVSKSPKSMIPPATLLVLLPLMSRGVASQFHNVSTHGGKVIKY